MTHLLYPTTNLKAIEQLTITRGEGVYVYDDRGRRYLEGLAGLWCTSLGYGNEELVEAAASQMRLVTSARSITPKAARSKTSSQPIWPSSK